MRPTDVNQVTERSTEQGGTRVMDADAALVELYRAHYAALVRLAILLADDIASAEDLVQDAFVKLHRNWNRLRDPAAAVPYLRACVVNGGRSRLRRLKTSRAHLANQPREVPHSPSAEHDLLLTEGQREVLAAVQTLPERQRHVLVLRYYGDCTEAETADTLGISLGAVKSHAHRAIASLGKKLEASR
ncbi:MAG: polymerase subunit sigma-24 [Frankiales bacterium]|nr:polymerase subunit sigma-24 [Frankiales bacterium]